MKTVWNGSAYRTSTTFRSLTLISSKKAPFQSFFVSGEALR
ncbi:MAG: hypothetical protein ACRDH8_14500 [Actinomycetota bacterium]